ncbi:MAG: phosphoglucosamine mutase [Armatimonas sp.]
MRKHFGTDGVRGVANTDLTIETALALGAAAAHVFGTHKEIVVGRDPRRSGDLLEAAFTAGVLSQGADIASLGVIPTPGVSVLTRQRGAAAGVVISASHNPMADNGIKFFGPDGKKLSDSTELAIEAAMESWITNSRPSGAGVGRKTDVVDALDTYSDFLEATLGGTRLDGLTIVVDGANGAAAKLAPLFLTRLGAKVTPIACEPDGLNINEGVGSTHPTGMLKAVGEHGADLGVSFDGDADRAMLSDSQGRLFDGDRMLCAGGLWLKERGTLTNNTVVGTVMSNLGLEKALKEAGITLERAAVGDRYVTELLDKTSAALGGEQSGHILFPQISPAGDGLLTLLQMLRICLESGKTLAQWYDAMATFPQKLVNVYVTDKTNWESDPEITAAISVAQATLNGRGRLLVRPSGTEKMIRVMAEAETQPLVDETVDSVAAAVRKARGV